MVDIKHVTPDFAVAGQIAPADISSLAAMGFKSIICNRPDREQWGQPEFQSVAEAARAAGMQTESIPFSPGAMSATDVEAFRAALARLPAPVLAYCRSGARSLNIYTVAVG